MVQLYGSVVWFSCLIGKMCLSGLCGEKKKMADFFDGYHGYLMGTVMGGAIA